MAGAALGAEVEGGAGVLWGQAEVGLRRKGLGMFHVHFVPLQAAAAVTVAFTKEALKKAMEPLAETPGRSSAARVGMTGAGQKEVA